MEDVRKQGYCNIALEIEKAVCFSKLSEVSCRNLDVVSKTMEFARKQGFCNIALERKKAPCFSKLSEVNSRILLVLSQ